MKFEFKPEDFPAAMVTIDDGRPGSAATVLNLQHLVCDNANKRLAEMLSDAPTVYGFQTFSRRSRGQLPKAWDTRRNLIQSHQARLVEIRKVNE
jgi:hypothetical protein